MLEPPGAGTDWLHRSDGRHPATRICEDAGDELRRAYGPHGAATVKGDCSGIGSGVGAKEGNR